MVAVEPVGLLIGTFRNCQTAPEHEANAEKTGYGEEDDEPSEALRMPALT
jgi:hypothetical protein